MLFGDPDGRRRKRKRGRKKGRYSGRNKVFSLHLSGIRDFSGVSFEPPHHAHWDKDPCGRDAFNPKRTRVTGGEE
jgi:hypothetical protein